MVDPSAGQVARQQAAHDKVRERMESVMVGQERDRVRARLRRAKKRLIRIREALDASLPADAYVALDEDDADVDE